MCTSSALDRRRRVLLGAGRAFAAATPGADAWTFIVAIGAAFALSPIVWLHYFVLLYIPIAIVRPRLSWLWALPLALLGRAAARASTALRGTRCRIHQDLALHRAHRLGAADRLCVLASSTR